ncbi:SAGA-associated factor 73-like [Quercus suber]|uniref:SAGA-associated factor 73-like n=1 Tax=Quercus suber TaxID=58331 RepID=UPI0032DE302F
MGGFASETSPPPPHVASDSAVEDDDDDDGDDDDASDDDDGDYLWDTNSELAPKNSGFSEQLVGDCNFEARLKEIDDTLGRNVIPDTDSSEPSKMKLYREISPTGLQNMGGKINLNQNVTISEIGPVDPQGF